MSEVTLKTIFQVKRGLNEAWERNNPILRVGEPGFAIDKNILKIGDGATAWKDLKPVNKELLEQMIKDNGSISIDNENVQSVVSTTEKGVEIKFVDKTTGEESNIIVNKNGAFYVKGDKLPTAADEIMTKKDGQSAHLEVIKIYNSETADSSATVNGTKYNTVEDAIAAAPVGSTVTLSSSIDSPIQLTKELTLDMNNAVISTDEYTPFAISANGNITFKGNGSVECNKHGAAPVENSGIVQIEDGEYFRTIDEKNNGFYAVLNHGEMTINGGLFSSPGGLSSLIENGYQNYNSGDAKTGYVAGINSANPQMTINGGTFINDYTTIKNDDGANCVINNGNFYGMIYNPGQTVTINNGFFSCSDGYENIQVVKSNETTNNAKLIINGGIFETNGQTNIKTTGDAIVEIAGGSFNHAIPQEFIKEGYVVSVDDKGYYTVTKGE